MLCLHHLPIVGYFERWLLKSRYWVPAFALPELLSSVGSCSIVQEKNSSLVNARKLLLGDQSELLTWSQTGVVISKLDEVLQHINMSQLWTGIWLLPRLSIPQCAACVAVNQVWPMRHQRVRIRAPYGYNPCVVATWVSNLMPNQPMEPVLGTVPKASSYSPE